ncbi:MAG: cytochrome c oxidase subunit II [Phycisphaeraceae bacterium]
MTLLVAQSEPSLWMPSASSTVAGEVDSLFYFILWICVVMFLLILALMILFIAKYRQRPGYTPVRSPSHSTALELTWTVIPTIVVMVIFYAGFKGYLNMATPPPNAYEIQVYATKWSWEFTYPTGYPSTNELRVPLNRPVRLVMQSGDVIHSLYIPAFRVKKDCVPGRFNHMWFQATELGEFDLYCAEYCGQNHSTMLAKVIVQEPTVFSKWLEDAGDVLKGKTPVEAGKYLYNARKCSDCHSLDGRKLAGPSFKGLFGSSHPLRDGTSVTVDENYIRDSILYPAKQVVAGYDNVMPSFQGRLKDDEIAAIIAFIKSLNE